MCRTQRQLELLNFKSDKNPNTAPKQSQTETPYLRQPVVAVNKFVFHSETDSDYSDLEGSVPSRRNTYKNQTSIWTAGKGRRTKATTTKPDVPERDHLHSKKYDSGEDDHRSKRQKLLAMVDTKSDIGFDEFLEPASNKPESHLSIGAILSEPANLDLYPIISNNVHSGSPTPHQTEAMVLVKTSMSPAVPFTPENIISDESEEDDDQSEILDISMLEDVNGDRPMSPHPRQFFEIVSKMRASYMACRLVTERKAYRWINDPSNPNSPPIREKPVSRDYSRPDRVYQDSQDNRIWHFCSVKNVDKKICTVEDLPVLVATAYCESTYRNEKRLVATLVSGYHGIRKTDIEWCLLGVRPEKAPSTARSSSPPQSHEDKAREDRLSLPSHPNDKPSETTYITPSLSRDDSISHVPEENTSASSSPLSSPPPTEILSPHTNRSHPSPVRKQTATTTAIYNSTSLNDLVHDYKSNAFTTSTTHLNTLITLQTQVAQKRRTTTTQIQAVEADISNMTAESALLRGRLSLSRQQSIGQIIDEERVEKEQRLGKLNNEVKRLTEKIEDLDGQRERVRGERQAFVRRAKGLRDEVVKFLAWVDELGVEEDETDVECEE